LEFLALRSGNATAIVSVYSDLTTTGKSLSIIAVNSLIGMPKPLFLSKQDSANAFYGIRGMLNSLPCSIDEVTVADDEAMADMAYTLSQGREKITMTKERELRKPATWCGPTHMTSNYSLYKQIRKRSRGQRST